MINEDANSNDTLTSAANIWWAGNPPYNCEFLDLSNMDLSGMDMTNANLKSTILEGTIFKGVTSMFNADLTNARMGNGTDFSGCNLTNTIFDKNPIFNKHPIEAIGERNKPTKFINATIKFDTLGTDWSNIDLTNTKILDMPSEIYRLQVINTNITGVNFSGKKLDNAHFFNSILNGADFSNANLNCVTFGQQTDLTQAKFTNASLYFCVFDTALLKNTDFTDAKFIDRSTFLQANMEGTRFDNTNLTNCIFSKAPNFSKNSLNRTSFRDAILNLSAIGMEWSFLDLTGTTLNGFENSNDFTGLKAQYSILKGHNFNGKILESSDFTGAVLDGVNFNGCHMSNSSFRGVQSTSCILVVPTEKNKEIYINLLDALENNNNAAISSILSSYKLLIDPQNILLKSIKENQSWDIKDISTGKDYRVANCKYGDYGVSIVVLDLSLSVVFDKSDLTASDFGKDKDSKTILRGASFNGVQINKANFSFADLGLIDPTDITTASRFKSASIISAEMNCVDLTGAQFTNGEEGNPALLHGTNFTNSTLKGANLTGAQLGQISELFSLSSSNSDYSSLINALNLKDWDSVYKIFKSKSKDIDINVLKVDISTIKSTESWNIDISLDDNTFINYTAYVLIDNNQNDKASCLVVGKKVDSACLSGVYMPDAILNNANLLGVNATQVQIFQLEGTPTLNNAILDSIIFTSANLMSLDMSKASLCNAVINMANLYNTKLKGCNLTGAKLTKSNLIGTDFDDAITTDADFSNAAVAIDIGSDSDEQMTGVYLFSVSKDKDDYDKILAELKAVSFDPYVEEDDIGQYLDNKEIVKSISDWFVQNNVKVSEKASIYKKEDSSDTWWISNPGNEIEDYTIWRIYDSNIPVYNARPTIDTLKAVIETNHLKLSWHPDIASFPDSNSSKSNRWEIRNSIDSKYESIPGYLDYMAISEEKGISFYAISFNIQVVNYCKNETMLLSESCLSTILKKSNGDVVFDSNTICPNTSTYITNLKANIPWNDILSTSMSQPLVEVEAVDK